MSTTNIIIVAHKTSRLVLVRARKDVYKTTHSCKKNLKMVRTPNKIMIFKILSFANLRVSRLQIGLTNSQTDVYSRLQPINQTIAVLASKCRTLREVMH